MSGHASQQPLYGQQQNYNQTENDCLGFSQVATVTSPGIRPSTLTVVLSPKEMAIMKECTDESIVYRSMPMSIAAMGATHLLVKRGILKPSLKFGSKPKVAIAALLFYYVGKFSYANVCCDKFLSRAPRSMISDAVRNRRGWPPLEPEASAGADYAGLGVNPQESTSPLQYSYQPEQGSEGSPLQPQPLSTNKYEDLRRRNREMIKVPNDRYISSMPQVGQGADGQVQGSVYDERRRRNRQINPSQHYPLPAPLQAQQHGCHRGQDPPSRPYPLDQPPISQQRQGESKYGDVEFE